MANRDPIPALKEQLGRELAGLVTGWNADDIAALLRTDRARVSEIRRGKLARFSLETLIRYLARLRHRVDIRVVEEHVNLRRATSARATADGARREKVSEW
ncbi:MAG: XRE family transcriptional regulator [Gemmatimonadaceae bacterium]